MGDRPLYSFHLKIDGDDTDESIKQRIAAIEAFAQYLRVLDRGADFVDHNIAKNQALPLAALKENVESARKSLMRDLAGIDSEVRYQTNSLSDLAKKIAVVTNSAIETQTTALEADRSDDDARKMSSRGLLQTAMIDFADKIASLDDGVVKLADDWKIKPATNKPLEEVHWIEVSAASVHSGPERVSIPTRPSEPTQKPPMVEKSDGQQARGTAAWDKKVTLKPPYHESYPGAPTDKLSLQYAVKEILGQAGLSYDSKGSSKNASDECRRWVYPNWAASKSSRRCIQGACD